MCVVARVRSFFSLSSRPAFPARSLPADEIFKSLFLFLTYCCLSFPSNTVARSSREANAFYTFIPFSVFDARPFAISEKIFIPIGEERVAIPRDEPPWSSASEVVAPTIADSLFVRFVQEET